MGTATATVMAGRWGCLLVTHDSLLQGEHDPHDMSVGLGVLSGMIAFLCVEKFVRIMKVASHTYKILLKLNPTILQRYNPENLPTYTINPVLTALLHLQGGHGHSHGPPAPAAAAEKKVEKAKKKAKDSDAEEEEEEEEKGDKKEKVETKEEAAAEEEIKVAGYLNLAADMFHNFTDGLAIGASFLAGESIGVITTLTILLHEVGT